MQTKATIIADSTNTLNGVRVISIELSFPRFILPQLLMHRNFSRSCESLRARPTASKAAEPCYVPAAFRLNVKGMVPGEVLDDDRQQAARDVWDFAMLAMHDAAGRLAALGVAKQWANRLLEPFAFQRCLFTGTLATWWDWISLRDAHDAQDEHCELARCVRFALDASKPRELQPGEWHLPYVPSNHRALRDVSAARCARVSYLKHDGTYAEIGQDIKLAESLRAARHSNPFEHQLTPTIGRYANFTGWMTYRGELGI